MLKWNISKLYRSLAVSANTIGLGRSVLIVDDDEDLRDVIAEDFTDQGYNVFVAESGEEALRLFVQERIDVVLTDIQMPNFNGIQLIKALKEINAKQNNRSHFIIMTGFTKYSREELLSCGATDLIEKPIGRNEMLKKITSLFKT